MTRKFRSNRMDSCCKNQKKSKNGCFLAIFGTILALLLTSQQYEFDGITHKGPYNSVEGLYKISFESYGLFLRKSKKVEKRLFFGHFWVNFGYVSYIPAMRI